MNTNGLNGLALTHPGQHDVEHEAGDSHRPAHGGDGVTEAGVALRQLLPRRPVAVHHHRLMRVAHQVPGHHRAPVPPSHIVLPLEVRGGGRGGGPPAVHHLHLELVSGCCCCYWWWWWWW